MAEGLAGLIAGTRSELVSAGGRTVAVGSRLARGLLLAHVACTLLTETQNLVHRELLEEVEGDDPGIAGRAGSGSGSGSRPGRGVGRRGEGGGGRGGEEGGESTLQPADGRCSDAQERLLAGRVERQRRCTAA